MNWRLMVARFYVPPSLKKKGIEELFLLTADAFGVEPKFSKALSSLANLKQYALFTKEEAETVLASGSQIQKVKDRLFQNAYSFGGSLRRRLHPSSPDEVMAAARILYRLIQIDFKGNTRGEIVIGRCFFSRFYSPEVCGLISALDEGILTGLCGGGDLRFSQRITDGKDCCRAQMVYEDPSR
jgi:hypothetical protein